MDRPPRPSHTQQVVSTHYEVGGGLSGRKDTVLQYQMVVNRSVWVF